MTNLRSARRVESRRWRSSPPPRGSATEPKLSGRNRRDLFVLATGVCGATWYYLVHRDNDWDEEVRGARYKLMRWIARRSRSRSPHTEFGAEGSLDSALRPFAFHRYLSGALPPRFGNIQDSGNSDDPSFLPTVATVTQSGEFFAARQWHPFEATLTASMVPDRPGFVWDARTTIVGLPHSVLECLLPSNNELENDSDSETANSSSSSSVVGSIVTKAWGKYPLIKVEEEDPYVLFWLASTPLFPSVFCARPLENDAPNGMVALEWSAASSTGNATAHLLCNDGVRRRLEFVVDPDDTNADNNADEGVPLLLRRIRVIPNKDTNDGDPWQATYGDYRQCLITVVATRSKEEPGEEQRHDGGDSGDGESARLLWRVPTTIEIGKGTGEDYRPRFRIRNHRIEFGTPGEG